MKSRARSLSKIFQALTLIALASAAQASTLTYYIDVFGSTSYGNTTLIPVSSSTEMGAGATATISVPKLDMSSAPAGFEYVLTSAQLTLTWESDGSVNITNLSCFDFTAGGGCQEIPFQNASASVPMTVTMGGVTVVAPGVAGPLSSSSTTCPSSPITCATYPGEVGYVAGANETVINGGQTSSYSGLHYGPVHGDDPTGNPVGNLSLFEGFGPGTIFGSVGNGIQSFAGNVPLGYHSDLAFGGTSKTGGILSVTYTFVQVPVPEPTSMVLIGSSILGLGLLLRRKARKP
jgi:hypothetical protein